MQPATNPLQYKVLGAKIAMHGIATIVTVATTLSQKDS
jgi:hypothetical protein